MRISGRYCEKVILPTDAFDRRSFRWKKSGRGLVLVGCRRGGWRKGRCGTGLRAHAVLRRSKRCRSGEKRIAKGHHR